MLVFSMSKLLTEQQARVNLIKNLKALRMFKTQLQRWSDDLFLRSACPPFLCVEIQTL